MGRKEKKRARDTDMIVRERERERERLQWARVGSGEEGLERKLV